MRLFAVFFSLALVGCGPPPPPKFSEVQDKVFKGSCVFSTCHAIAGGGAGGLQLEPSVAYAALVNVPSTGAPSKTRVVPGDLTKSYLIEKLTSATPTAGTQMPQGGDTLDSASIQLVKDWISAGAKND